MSVYQEIPGFVLVEGVLSDGSPVYDVIGSTEEARVTFNCTDKESANQLHALLSNVRYVSGVSAEFFEKSQGSIDVRFGCVAG